MAHRKLVQRKSRELLRVESTDDDDDDDQEEREREEAKRQELEMLGLRKSQSFPEELMSKILSNENNKKKEAVEGSDSDSEEEQESNTTTTKRAHHAHTSRLKSSGQLQSALVTLSIRECDTLQLWRLLSRRDVDINYVDGLGMQPIHYAAKYGNVEVLKILIQYKVDINTPTSKGEYPLDYAVKSGNFEVAQFLVDRGARVKSIVDGINKDSNARRRKISQLHQARGPEAHYYEA